MKYSVVVMLFVGAISTAEAVYLGQKNSIQLDMMAEPTKVQVAEKNVKDQAIKSADAAKKVDALKAQQTTKTVKQEKVENKPPKDNSHIQTKGDNMIVSIEAIKKPEGADKAQELAAMEEALKKATQEAHNQRIAITGEESGIGSMSQSGSLLQNKALQELKTKQESQQKQLLEQLANEEKQRENELKQNIELEAKIAHAEKERQNEEVLAKSRAGELKLLQEEEAAQKLEAEKKEQEFLAAQAVQETKAAAAKKAAAKANLARMKRKHELQRRKAEAQLQMLKVKQQMEAEQAIENEKANPSPKVELAAETETASLVQAKNKEQIAAELKAETEKKVKAEAEKKAKEEAEKKAKEEAEKKAAVEKKAAEDKKVAEEKAKAEAEKKKKEEAEKKAAAEKKKDEKHQELLKKLNQECDSFSVSLNKKHFDSAVQLKNQIKEQGFEEPKLKINSLGIYKKSFTFPQIANNDYAIEQFETLAVAEANLNNDLSNESTFDAFVSSADQVAHNLTERYKDQWVDPKDDRGE